jgi:hypothetical protein
MPASAARGGPAGPTVPGSPKIRSVSATVIHALGWKAPRCTKRIGVRTGLASVIASAARGSVVCLTGGDYGHVAIRNIHKAKPVAVRAVKGSSASVDLEIDASSGLRLVGLTISDLLMANSADITLSHNTFTGMSLVQTQRARANILFNSNRLDGNNSGPNDNEGRLTIRGYKNTRPVGVTIRNNHFGGGCSDGIQVIGDAYGVRIGPGNEFTRIRQSGCGQVHADPIQLYGASHTTITGNYFHDNGDGSGGIMMGWDSDFSTVSNNVFVCSCVYPWSIHAGSTHNSVFRHNTFAGGGEVRFELVNGVSPSGDLVRDNAFTSGGGISTDGSNYGSNHHNLNARASGRGNIAGRPIFVGGKKPTSYAGYRLAPRSRGKRAASDGGDMGIRPRG